MTAVMNNPDYDYVTGTEAKSGPLWQLEHLGQEMISMRRFLARMSLAIGVWCMLILIGLSVGMAGYAWFESMSFVDAYLNASMILSGVGEITAMKTTGGKIFTASYALFSGLVIAVATGIVITPVFHRVLHRFHIYKLKEASSDRLNGRGRTTRQD